MHFNLYITFNKNKYFHSNFEDLGSQSYIEPGDTSVPLGTTVAKHHLSVVHIFNNIYAYSKNVWTYNVTSCDTTFEADSRTTLK
jgi:hypothetical protein